MIEPVVLFFASILLTILLTGFLAGYAWRQPREPGVRTFALLMLDECLLAGAEAASMLSGSPAQALFWFNLRFLFISTLSVLWVVFAIQYVGRSDWLSKRLLAGLFAIPVLTQVLLWTNPLHHWWMQQDVAFRAVDGFWLADTTVRVPGLWFMVHNFYTTLLTLATMIALLVSIGRKRSIYRGQAILVSLGLLAALTIAQIQIFNIAPQLPYNPFIPGLGLGALFVLAAVVGFRFLGRTPTQEQISRVTRLDAQDKRSLASLVLIFYVFVAGVTAIAYFTYRDYASQFRIQAENQLAAITGMKVDELVDWRNERLADASLFYQNSNFSARVKDYLTDPSNADYRSHLEVWLNKLLVSPEYREILLLDAGGRVTLALPQGTIPVNVYLVAQSMESLHSGQVSFLDFHRHTEDDSPHLSLLVPIIDPENENQPLGILVLVIDPGVYLYPYIQLWPASGESGETLIVRQEAGGVVYLNPLRFMPESALTLRVPLTETDLPAVQAALGQTGVVEGRDYRGVEVLASINAVPDSPWFLVAKMDASEVYAPLRARLWQTLLFLGMLIVAGGTGLVTIWRQQQVRNFRIRLESHDTLAASEEKFRKAFLITPDSVAITRLSDGKFISVNAGFTNILGYTAEEVLGRSSLELDIWDDPQDRQNIVSALQEYGQVQNYEARFRTKQGEIRHGLMSAAVIELNGETHILHTTRDITERKQAEEEVKSAQTFLELVIDMSPIAMWISDTGGTITRVNRALCETINLTEDVIVGNYNVFQDANLELQGVMPRIRAVFEEHTSTRFSIPWKAAETGDVDFSGARDLFIDVVMFPILDTAGKLVNVVCQWFDLSDRKHAEDALRASEQRYQTLADISPVGIFRTDMQGHTTYVNPRWSEISGLPGEHALGDGWLEAVHPEDRQPLAEGWKEVAQRHNPSHSEYRFVRPDGSVTWVMGQAVPEMDADGGFVGYVGTITDITERKQTEDALRFKDELLHMTSEMAKIGGWEFDAATGGGTWTDEVARIHDLDPADPTNVKIGVSFYLPESRRKIEQSIQEAINEAKPYDLELEMVTAKGKHKWVRTMGLPILESGKVVKVQGIFQDITERKLIEDALRESEKNYRLLFDEMLSGFAVHEIICDADGEPVDYRFLAINSAFEKLTGLKAADILGKTVREALPGTEPIWIERYGHVALTREAIQFEDYFSSLKKHFEVRAFSPELGKFAVIFNDITDRKQAEETLQQYSARLEADVIERTRELREAQEKLVRQERLAVLGQLAGSVGHELRNPLGVISNAAYYLNLIQPNAEAKVKDYLQIIENETRIAEQIIADLLDFARIKNLDRQPVDAAALVAQTLERYPLPPGVKLTRRIGAKLPQIFVDPRQMTQVLGNLMENACQAMEGKGSLVIRAKREHGMVALSVTDSGPGISPENLEKVFEPLFTTKVRGIGLGLAVSQRFVEANGGRIEVRNEDAGGCTFTLHLPVHEANHE